MNCFFHPDEPAVASCVDCGKGLCKTCAALYTISICSDCNLKRNESEKNLAVRKYIPSFVLFVLGFIAGFIFLGSDADSFSVKIAAGLAVGWALGGTIWGWFITRTWFRPKVYINTGMDANAFFHTAGGAVRIMVAVLVGFVALPVGLIKLIITFIKTKRNATVIKDNKAGNG